VQVRGKDAASTAQVAETLQEQIKDVPGAVDVFVQQEVNAPKLNIKVDRLKAQEIGLTVKDVADDVLLSLSGSGQVAPNFWLDPKTGVEYPVIVQVHTAWTTSIRWTGRPSRPRCPAPVTSCYAMFRRLSGRFRR
jgi:Cu/Ag efflux pump CusA